MYDLYEVLLLTGSLLFSYSFETVFCSLSCAIITQQKKIEFNVKKAYSSIKF